MKRIRKHIAFILSMTVVITNLANGASVYAVDEKDSRIETESVEKQEQAVEYKVANESEFNDAIEKIKNQDSSEATILLKKSIVLPNDYFGVEGKNITIDSDGSTTNRLMIKKGYKALRLSGNVKFENIIISTESLYTTRLYAEGYRVEFGEKYKASGLRLYGGSDHNLDLSKDGNKSGTTHIIIRSGSFHSIVAGNTDIFNQGESHEYVDWSDETKNVHTTLKGDTLIEMYGGTVNGKYNIDVGDTCCNTSVTPVYIYGGGLGSDTIGSTNIKIYNLTDGTSNLNNRVVAGGFGMGGDENDQTIYNNKVKHTGIVSGDTNLTVLGGTITEFYGGGFHNGSAYTPNSANGGERAQQVQYNRDKIATVGGDVNVTLGGTSRLAWQGKGYAGSYASTVFGDINVIVKDQAKIANTKNAQVPSNMKELVSSNDYDAGWPDQGLFGTGYYDIIHGTVNIDIQNGYAHGIYGTADYNPFDTEFKSIPRTEIKNTKNEKYAMNIVMTDGMVKELYGDYYTGKINGGISIDIHGGQVFSLIGYDGRNESFVNPEHTSVDVNIQNAIVYGVTGVYSTDKQNIKSTLNYSGNEKITNGTLEGFDSVVLNDNSDVLLDATQVMKKFSMKETDYGADQDLPFYKEVYHLNLKDNSRLETCKTATNLLGDVSNNNGTWIANGKVDVSGSLDSANGMMFFKEPSLIGSNVKWNSTELRLPNVEDSNYNGTTVKDIALTIDGQSEGSANVTIVDKDDYTKMIIPKEKDNYILSNGNKNSESNSEIVYYLNNGKDEGLYLKSVDDLAEVKHNNMWQVAKQDETTWYYEVYYQNPDGSFELWENAQGGKAMPGTTVSISHESFDGEDLGWGEVLGEHYVFDETNPNNRLSATAGEATKQNPLRIYYRCAPHTITYKFEGDVPEGVTPPQETETWYSAEVEIPDVSKVEGYEFLGWQIVSPDDAEIVDGVLTMPNDDVVVKGVWKVNRYSVSYRFESSDKDKKLPEEIQKLKPADEEDAIKYGETATPSKASFNDVEDKENDGVWKFKGWKPEKVDNVSSDVEFIGIWEFIPNRHHVQYKFVSGTEDMELPEEFDRYLPKDTHEYVKGDIVKAPSLKVDYISVGDGAWVFAYEDGIGWDANEKTVGSEDITFVGTWKYIENAYYVDYQFVSDNGQNLPKAIKDMLPQEYAIRPGETAEVKKNSFQNVDIRDAGSWVFLGWDRTSVEDVHDNITFKGTWKYYEKQTVIGENLVVYEGGLGSGNSQVTGNALPEPQWSSKIGSYTVTVDGKPWDISKQGLPFSWEYRDSDGKTVKDSAKVGTYGLYAYPMKGYEGKNVIINDKLLVLPVSGIKVSEVSVRDVTDNNSADNLSTETFKNVYNYESPLEEKKDNIFTRIYKEFMSLFNSDSALEGDFNENGTHDETCDNTIPHAHVLKGTTFVKNGNEDMLANRNAKIGLLWDELIPEVLGNYKDRLHQKSVDEVNRKDKNLFDENKEIHSKFKYMDLVDMNDGNIWVSTVKNDVTIYVPYPKGMDKNDRIAVTYYDGLTRDYTIDMENADLESEVNKTNAHMVEVTKTDTGILFNVPTKQFGSFEFLWQEDYYAVDYEFKSSDESMTLPDEVISLTPQDSNTYKEGSEVKAIMPTQSEVKLENGVWRFDGYDADAKTANQNITFIGTWTFEISRYSVDYKFQSITEGKDIPEEVKKLVPLKQTYKHGDMAKIVSPAKTTVNVDEGRWVFIGYDRKDESIPVTSDMTITGYWRFDGKSSVLNNIPYIIADNKTFKVGDEFNDKIALKDVTAYDEEDGDVTESLEVIDHNVDTSKAGIYYITYKATDSLGASSTKTINVYVYPTIEDINNIPVIDAKNKELNVGDSFDPRKDVTATDKEDGNLTDAIEIVENTVDTTKAGTYHVTYKVTDKDGASSIKTIKVVVKEKEVPIKPDKPSQPEIPENPKQPISPVETPQTGDKTGIITLTSLLTVSGLLLVLMKKRRKQ